jgi:hypothetical protein
MPAKVVSVSDGPSFDPNVDHPEKEWGRGACACLKLSLMPHQQLICSRKHEKLKSFVLHF